MVKLKDKLKVYYITSIVSVLFAIVGFSYNAWRLEVSEDNSSKRTAAFEILQNLAELEQVVFAAHYDLDKVDGNPRKGWVKVGLIDDLSALVSTQVSMQSTQLTLMWSENWSNLGKQEQAVTMITAQIDNVRLEVKQVIHQLN